MKENPFHRLTVDIPKELQKELKLACVTHSISMRKFVVEAIKDKLKTKNTK